MTTTTTGRLTATFGALTLVGALLSQAAQALPPRDNTWTVTSAGNTDDANTGDSACADSAGHCTLRAAIEQAGASSGTDLIRFAIGTGPVTINASAGLPGVARGITIDGTTQPGYDTATGNPAISLDGRGMAVTGLDLVGPDDVVIGLEVGNFTGTGISVDNGYVTIEGCYVGVDRTGTRLRPNATGIVLQSTNNIVAATHAGKVNVVAGNTSRQVFVGYGDTHTTVSGIYVGTTADGTATIHGGGNGIDAFGNYVTVGAPGKPTVVASSDIGVNLYGSFSTVQDAFVGTNAAGTAALPNSTGISMGNNNVALNNLVAGNYSGISAAASSVWGNWIGLAAGGTQALPNHIGVQVGTGALIGGYAPPSSGNVVSGNAIGVIIQGNSTVAENRIGTDAFGTSAVPNGVGVQINGTNNDVSQNVVSGNTGNGIEVESGARFQRINGNVIGQNEAAAPLGNAGDGVHVDAGSTTDQVADIGSVGGNVIADNAGAAVRVASGNGVNLTQNRIFDNGGLGIDLAAGANLDQSRPSLRSAAAAWAHTTINGSLSSAPSTDYRIDFYGSATCDPSGFGEGARWLGSADTTTDASGIASLRYTTNPDLAPPHTYVTATATDPDGNTSGFSSCRPVTGGIADLQATEAGGGTTVAPGHTVTYGATVKNTGPDTAAAVALTLTVSRYSKLQSVQIEGGTCTFPTFYRAVCAIGSMTPGAGDVASFTVEYGQAGRFAVRADVSTKTYDPNHLNNTASVTTHVS